MWPTLTIGVVFTETPTYYRYTSQKPCTFLLFLSIHPLLENFPDLKFFALILAEKKRFSMISLIGNFSKFSLIVRNPDYLQTSFMEKSAINITKL